MLKFWHNLSFYAKRLSQARVLLLPKVLCIFKSCTHYIRLREPFLIYNQYYEKAKELKPDNKALWGNYLLNIYWKLNRAEYDSLEKELGY